MTHHQVTHQEKLELLREQHSALIQSGKSYDQGNLWEAKRIATSAYLLCHDPLTTGKKTRTKSLLGQIGCKTSMKFLSTARPLSKTFIPWTPLIHMHASADSGHGFNFVPMLENNQLDRKWISFTRWWDEEVFKSGDDSFTLTRKNLVFSMRDQDGGAHVDEHLTDPAYLLFKTKNDIRLTKNDDEPIPNAHLATMRQIGFELQSSISEILS